MGNTDPIEDSVVPPVPTATAPAKTTPISGIKEIVAKAKEVKARKEGLKFLIKVAKLHSQMREAEEKLNKFVADEGLSKDIIEEAKTLTDEDIEAINEFIQDERKMDPNTFTYFPMYSTGVVNVTGNSCTTLASTGYSLTTASC